MNQAGKWEEQYGENPPKHRNQGKKFTVCGGAESGLVGDVGQKNSVGTYSV